LDRVDGFPLPNSIGDGLGLLLLWRVSLVRLFLICDLGITLWLSLIIIFFLFLLWLFFDLNFFSNILRGVKFDWVVDEFRVLFDEVFDFFLLDIFCGIIFQIEGHSGTTT
jgi:hypothetical protein